MNNMPIFSSDRLFEVWQYTVSHRQLLMRSNKSYSAPTRLEVLFKDVAFMAVPPVMKGMSITNCTTADEELLLNLAALPSSKPWYRLEADGAVGYIAAGTIVTNEDELGYEEASPLLAVLPFGS
ncbi:MAG TPA: hypothetical protein VGM83_02005 [Devosiaceae bacterium]|jgi:hypothetical protein